MKRLLLAVPVVRCAVAEEMSMVIRPTSGAGEVGMKICAAKKSLFRSILACREICSTTLYNNLIYPSIVLSIYLSATKHSPNDEPGDVF